MLANLQTHLSTLSSEQMDKQICKVCKQPTCAATSLHPEGEAGVWEVCSPLPQIRNKSAGMPRSPTLSYWIPYLKATD